MTHDEVRVGAIITGPLLPEPISAAGRAVGFIMAMLQRRMASSIYAVRRSLERMEAKREDVLADPEAYRKQRIKRRIPDDFDDLPDDEQAELLSRLEDEVISIDPAALREDIARLATLIAQARGLEARGVGTKLAELRRVLTEIGAFSNAATKLLLFTEHKDTLSGGINIRQPTVFLDGLVPAPPGTALPDDAALPDRHAGEQILLEQALQPCLAEVAGERAHQNETVRRHVEISLQTLIDRQNLQLADYLNRQVEGQNVPGPDGLISQAEGHLDRLNERLEGGCVSWRWSATAPSPTSPTCAGPGSFPIPSGRPPTWPRWSATTRSSGSPWSSRNGENGGG